MALGPARNGCNAENYCSFETPQVLCAKETLVFLHLIPQLLIEELHLYLCEMLQKGQRLPR